ncbi:hypothetical protein Nhal_3163 [Nitrosococcus halophilus Nc 4]|uniref:DUF2157 domain-containing protein n=1 Tax=Nitrosococcus halophilus (strain Nc4) TaxID=472759 RepID=D5BZW8_NITHN|nr:hypothetical protein [Nitrosococcus halophilus]ADE16215.1 hypothetical protein Nhal_3163 [Nitrosococcus halophilus Nc 4]
MNAETQAQVAQPAAPQPSASRFSFKFLPRLLRGLGALAVVASLSIFLLQGWESGNDSYRYLLLLAHTAGLAVIGFGAGHWLRESKGARLLLLLALVSVPANFAILGAFVYSASRANSIAYPVFATWQAESFTVTGGLIAGAVLVLAPVTWLGFRVLARHSAWSLAGLFLATNGVLLIPLREEPFVAWTLLGLTIFVLWRTARIGRGDTAMKTLEGAFARGLQFLPLALLFGRTVWLYTADAFLFTAMSVTAFLMLRQVALELNSRSKLRSFSEQLAILPALTTGLGLAAVVDKIIKGGDAYAFAVFSWAAAAMIFEISLRTPGSGASYRRKAAVVMTVGLLANLVLYEGVAAAILCLLTGMGVLVCGYLMEQRLVFGLGWVMLIAGLSFQVQYAITAFDLGSWGSLAVLGVAAILTGSVIERHGPQLKLRLTQWGRQFKSWEY